MLKFLLDNRVLIVLSLCTLLMLVLLAVVVSAALRGGGAAGSAVKVLRLLGADGLQQSFRRAVKLIESNLATRAQRYNLSWTLLLNESDGNALPLRQSGLSSALSGDTSLSAAAHGIAWNFFDKGVVVQLSTSYLGSPDPDSDTSNGIWDEFLSLCRSYRPQRPFDCIVLAIPCALLLASDAQGQLALVARAKAIHRRLWLAQNRLALRFPIHLVVTECEQVPGFATFGAALPEPLRRSILGWVSPYELVAPFSRQWVDSAMDQVVGTVADSCTELCALEAAEADSSAYFLLPSEVGRLRAGLQAFCEALMRPSAYHESFLLRGIYLTGDGSASAVLLAGAAGLDGAPPALAATSAASLSVAAPAGHFYADATAAQNATGLALQDGMPLFLRDIFERKIFAEVGLVRAARRLRRPAVSQLAFWSALIVPTLLALGLVVAAVQLNGRVTAVLAYLKGLNVGSPGAGVALGGLPPDQKRAMAALGNFEALDDSHFGSVLMPGSWPLFDDLDAQLRERQEQGFANAAGPALRDAVRQQLKVLTGGRDPVTNDLIEGNKCTRQAKLAEQTKTAAATALNLDDLPQYRALMRYVLCVGELGQAVAAMQRLVTNDAVPASGKDLLLVVNALLNKDLPGTPTRTAALYRAAAQRQNERNEYGTLINSIQKSARDQLATLSTDMFERLFAKNNLLLAEAEVANSIKNVRESAQLSGDLAAQLLLWQKLRSAFGQQQMLLAAGKGDWMRSATLQLGNAQEQMLKSISANVLLGVDTANEVRATGTRGWSQFSELWKKRTAPTIDSGDGGLIEVGTGWAFSPERKKLSEAVTALLAPSYMQVDAPVFPFTVPKGYTIHWDKEQMKRADSLIKERGIFQEGTYLNLPKALQPAATELVNAALADSVNAVLALALTREPPELPSAATDDERVSVLRIRTWLNDIGAHDTGAREIANRLDSVLRSDALARLDRLEAKFNAAQVYLPRDATFQGWSGVKGAMLRAFGDGDAAGLNAYMAQQSTFIDDMSQQAGGALDQMGSAPAPASPSVARWKALLADRQRYLIKSPASTRMALEQFIEVGSADIDTGNCVDKLGTLPAQRRGDDPFATRLHTLQDALLKRCRNLLANKDQFQWQNFANAYNRNLGRRPPFAALPAAATDVVPADHDDVGAVLKLYDLARPASALAERDQGQWGARDAVRQADQQLRRVRDVLAPLYPSDDEHVGGLDVAVKFRVNNANEVGANQVIDWTMSIGGNSVRLADPPRALRWEPGLPVLLSLRLASNGLALPKMAPGQPNMSVSERTVVFRFDDPWALLSFIGTQRVAGTPDDDGREPLLRFEFPLVNAGTGTPLPAARVFVRLRVSAPGKQTALAWPLAFPAQAPPWLKPKKSQP